MWKRQFFISVLVISIIYYSVVYAQTNNELDDSFEVLAGNEVRDVEIDSDYVWVATDQGVNCYDLEKKQWRLFTTADGLISNQVTCIDVERKEGIFGQKSGQYVWFGTDSGICVYDKKSKTWERYSQQDGLSDNRVKKISAYGRTVWIITASGISVYDKKKNRWQSYQTLKGVPDAEMTCVYHDRRSVWVGTTRGLVRYNKLLEKWEYFTNRGSQWLGPRGDVRDTEAAPQQARSPLPDDYVNAIDGDYNNVYIATRSGLVVRGIPSRFDEDFDRKGYSKLTRPGRKRRNLEYQDQRRGVGSVRRAEQSATRDDGLTGSQINSIAVVGNYVWFGTDEGISRLDKTTGDFQTFNALKTGLPSDEVTSLLVDGAYVWIGTINGLCRYDKLTDTWKIYSTADGIADERINVIAADPKFIWVGTRKGLNIYNKSTEKWRVLTKSDGFDTWFRYTSHSTQGSKR